MNMFTGLYISGLIPLAETPGEAGGSYIENLLYVVAGFACIIILPRVLRRTKRPVKQSRPVREVWEGHKEQLRARESADHILSELVETSREISSRMDTKIRILNTLIRDAERNIARLEELQGLPSSNAVRDRNKGADSHVAHSRAGVSLFVPDDPEEDSGADDDEGKGRDNFSASAPTRKSVPETPVSKDFAADAIVGTGGNGPSAETLSAWTQAASGAVGSAPAANKKGRDTQLPLSGSGVAPVPEDMEDATRRQVMEFIAQGYPIPEVARMTGLSRQEVTLIQHLSKA